VSNSHNGHLIDELLAPLLMFAQVAIDTLTATWLYCSLEIYTALLSDKNIT